MTRYHYHENIKEFKNGNIHFRCPLEDRKFLEDKQASAIEIVSWILDEIDCYFIGETYCLSNYTEGITVYNCCSDLCYVLNLTNIESDLMSGRYIKLKARKPDETDREVILESESC